MEGARNEVLAKRLDGKRISFGLPFAELAQIQEQGEGRTQGFQEQVSLITSPVR